MSPYYTNGYSKQRRSNIRTGSAAYILLIGFLVNFLCIVAVGTRCRRIRFVFFYRTSYVGLTSRQHLATVNKIRWLRKTAFSDISASLGGQLIIEQDTSFFNQILSDRHHILHHLLPPEKVTGHDLRPRCHGRELPRADQRMRKTFIYRMLWYPVKTAPDKLAPSKGPRQNGPRRYGPVK